MTRMDGFTPEGLQKIRRIALETRIRQCESEIKGVARWLAKSNPDTRTWKKKVTQLAKFKAEKEKAEQNLIDFEAEEERAHLPSVVTLPDLCAENPPAPSPLPDL
jgi:hypothetical protein